jgi:hypothetical protein
VVGKPLLFRRDRQRARQQQRAHALAARDAQQHLVLAARGDHGVRAAARGALGREHLGQHAALGERRARAAGHRLERRIAGLAALDELRARGAARIGVVQPGLVGEQDQRVGFDEVGDQRAQGVVVAEPDLVGDHRVVLVDHRDHAEPEQRA